MKRDRLIRLALSGAVLTALSPLAWAGSVATPGSAQSATPAPQSKQGSQASSSPAPSKPHTLQAIVVTGNVTAGGIKELESSYAINVVTPQQIHDFAPHGTADLLKTIPGMWVESSGGATGANVYVSGFPGAGDAHFANVELDGAPLYGAYGLSFLSSPDLFRIDDSVKRVEVVQNGPNDIFGAGRPGATVNFIQKTGMSTPQGAGSVRLTVGPLGYQRVDAYWGGEIAPTWYLAGGGFARKGDGVHHTSFPVNRGGQVEAILTHTFDGDNGKISFSARHTNDNSLFLTDAPMLSVGKHLFPLDQFDPRKDTLEGDDLRYLTLQVAPGNPPGTVQRDLAQGRGMNLSVYGSKLSWKFGNGWSIANNFGYTYGNIPTNALFNNTAPPQTIASFIGDSITSANANPEITGVNGLATSGTATYTTSGQPVAPSQLVLQTGFWTVQKHIRSLTDDFNISKEIFEGNTLTAGAYYANYGDHDLWYLGNNLLTTLQNDASLVDVSLNNGVVVSNDGMSGPVTDAFAEHWRGENLAGYLSDSWFLGRWLLNGGVRIEHQRDTGYVANSTTADLDGNPATVYNNGASVFNGQFTRYEEDDSHVAWSLGANYGITDDMSAYARVSNGQLFPMFDDIQGGTPDIQTVRQYEVGFKSQSKFYVANVSVFYNHFHNLPFQALVEVNGQLINFNEAGSSAAKGVEADVTVQPTTHLSVNLTGDWLDGHYETFGDFSGNQLQRQPRLQFRITPAYTVPVEWGQMRAFVTFTQVGNRYGDPANDQLLPRYHTIDAGIQSTIGKDWSVQLVGRNITNTLALTEGNVRALFAANGGGGVIYGRSIFGRTWQLSAAYHF